MFDITVEINRRKGLKDRYDKEVCPKLKSNKRCKDCIYWSDLKKIDILRASLVKEYMGGKIPKEDLKIDRLYELKTAGCLLLTEICPKCIIGDQWIGKTYNLIPSSSKYDERITFQPAYVYKRSGRGNIFYCPKCKKKFKHDNVMHIININYLISRPVKKKKTVKEKKKTNTSEKVINNIIGKKKK